MIVLCCIMLEQKNDDSVSGYMCVNVIKVTYMKQVHFIDRFSDCQCKSAYMKPNPSVVFSNYEEAQKLSSDLYQEKVAWAIHMAIMQYLNHEDK